MVGPAAVVTVKVRVAEEACPLGAAVTRKSTVPLPVTVAELDTREIEEMPLGAVPAVTVADSEPADTMIDTGDDPPRKTVSELGEALALIVGQPKVTVTVAVCEMPLAVALTVNEVVPIAAVGRA